jgi:hypothetical protein
MSRQLCYLCLYFASYRKATFGRDADADAIDYSKRRQQIWTNQMQL